MLSQFVDQDFFPYLNYNRSHKHKLTLDAITLQEMIRYTWNFVRMIMSVIVITSYNFKMIPILVFILEWLTQYLWDALCSTVGSETVEISLPRWRVVVFRVCNLKAFGSFAKCYVDEFSRRVLVTADNDDKANNFERVQIK